jgi:hypothetical protein
MMAEFNNDTLFPVILASTVHDIKNSLGTLLGLIQQLALKQSSDQLDEIRQLGFEANRINAGDVQNRSSKI